MHFAQRLKEIREESKLSQQQLALEIGRKRTSISGYETYDRLPDVETLINLARFFDVSVDWLLGFSDFRKPINSSDNPELIYKQVFDTMREKFITHGIIASNEPIPARALELSLEYGFNAAVQIINLNKEESK